MRIKEWQDERDTLQLISQILGKHKVATAFQEPQWAHVVLTITSQGFTTGILHFKDKDYQINVNLLLHQIEIIVDELTETIPLKDGTTVKEYYNGIKDFLARHGITPVLNVNPQEMTTKIPLDEDETHHHYSKQAAVEAFKLMKLAYKAESRFLNPLRSRKVKAGLFWGTFDVSCILIYNEHVPFSDDSKVIERAAFDEAMIEFGFWFGDDKFEGPTFFVLPYPFSTKYFDCSDEFPEGSYYDESMSEFIITLKDLGDNPEDKLQEFFKASYLEFKNYLEWEGCSHYHIPLKMEENHTNKEID